jgi:hypothetical protein
MFGEYEEKSDVVFEIIVDGQRFGICMKKETAIETVKTIGIRKLEQFNNTATKWQVFTGIISEDDTIYTIQLQKLGRLWNGSVTIHSTIQCNEIPVVTSELIDKHFGQIQTSTTSEGTESNTGNIDAVATGNEQTSDSANINEQNHETTSRVYLAKSPDNQTSMKLVH